MALCVTEGWDLALYFQHVPAAAQSGGYRATPSSAHTAVLIAGLRRITKVVL